MNYKLNLLIAMLLPLNIVAAQSYPNDRMPPIYSPVQTQLPGSSGTVNVTFLQDGGGSTPFNPSMEASKMYALRVNSVNSTRWALGQPGSLIRVMCIDPKHTVGGGMTWNARITFLSDTGYSGTRRGHNADAMARYKKVSYLYTKLPALLPADNVKISNTIYYILGENYAPYSMPDSNLVNEVNAWYRGGAMGIDWNQIAILTDELTAYVGMGDTIPPAGGTQEFITFAVKQTPVTLPWVRGQQVIIMADSTKTPLTEGTTMKLTAYARTSAGVPVAAPLITWVVRDSMNLSSEPQNNTSTVVRAASALTRPSVEWVFASWSTRSGVFRDSVPITLSPVSFTLPWQPRQQVLTVRSNTGDLVAGGTSSTTMLTTYVRTSAGVPVANPKIVYTSNSPTLKVIQINNTTAQIVMVSSALLGGPGNYNGNVNNSTQTGVITATWKTLSGTLTSTTTISYITFN